MKISKVYAVYFSPAGSTKDVAERIAAKIASALDVPFSGIDFTLPEARKEKYRFASDELVVFGTPTYAGRIPNKALPFVQELFEAEGTPAVSTVTYGNRNFDSSLTELVQEMGGNGFHVFAAAAWTCRHVFSPLIAPGRPNEDDFAKMDDLPELSISLVETATGNPVMSFVSTKGRSSLKEKMMSPPFTIDEKGGASPTSAVMSTTAVEPLSAVKTSWFWNSPASVGYISTRMSAVSPGFRYSEP